MKVLGFKVQRAHFVDFCLVTILLLIPLLVLIVFRRLPSEPTNPLSSSFSIPVLAIYIYIWINVGVIFSLRREPSQPVRAARPTTVQRRLRTASVFRGLGICALLLVVTIAAFYVPMRRYFWTGNDEMTVITGSSIWSDNGENAYSRPMLFLSPRLSMAISNNSVVGFLSINLLLCYATAILTYGTIRMLMPRSMGIALIAALLYIVSPIEPARFYVIWMSVYPLQEFLLILFVGLFVQSYLHGRRWMLLIAGCLLMVSILVNEAILPATLLGPLLLINLWGKRRNIYRTLIWTYFWFGIEIILGLRFVLFIINPGRSNSYQAQFLGRAHSIEDLVANLIMQFSATFKYVAVSTNWSAYLSYGVFIGCLALGTLLIGLPRSEQKLPLKSILAVSGISVLAIVLSVSAFVLEWHVWRTEFLALPFHAILWALAIALVGRLMPQRLYRLWLVAIPTLLVTFSMSSVLATNEHSIYQWTPSAKPVPLYPVIQYDKTRAILQQVHHLAPAFTPQTVVLFYLDSSSPFTMPETPFGVGYYIRRLGNVSLNVMDAYQMNYVDFVGWTSKFTLDGFFTSSDVQLTYPYNQLVIFRVSQAGGVSLTDKIPANWLPVGTDASSYNPAARIIEDQQSPLPFFQ